MDPIQLATAALPLLLPYLQKGGEKIAEKFGGELYEKVKAKLTGPAAREAVQEVERAPDDGDAQAALRLQLRKALAEDEAFRRLVEELVTKAAGERDAAVSQSARTIGQQNKTVQVTGSGNTTTTG